MAFLPELGIGFSQEPARRTGGSSVLEMEQHQGEGGTQTGLGLDGPLTLVNSTGQIKVLMK